MNRVKFEIEEHNTKLTQLLFGFIEGLLPLCAFLSFAEDDREFLTSIPIKKYCVLKCIHCKFLLAAYGELTSRSSIFSCVSLV